MLGPAGKLHARRTLRMHRRGVLGPNGCLNPLRAVPAWGEAAGGQALIGSRDHAVAGTPCGGSGAWQIFHENRLPAATELWRDAWSRGRATCSPNSARAS